MRDFTLILLTMMLGTTFEAQAGNQCTDRNLVLDETQMKDFSGFVWSLSLPSYSVISGIHETGAVADFEWQSPNYMNIKFRFDLPEDMVSNPYNIYRMEFDVGEGPDAFHFETGDCSDSIGAFWPMDPLKVYPIKVSPHADGSARGIEPIHVRIWGHQ